MEWRNGEVKQDFSLSPTIENIRTVFKITTSSLTKCPLIRILSFNRVWELEAWLMRILVSPMIMNNVRITSLHLFSATSGLRSIANLTYLEHCLWDTSLTIWSQWRKMKQIFIHLCDLTSDLVMISHCIIKMKQTHTSIYFQLIKHHNNVIRPPLNKNNTGQNIYIITIGMPTCIFLKVWRLKKIHNVFNVSAFSSE